MSGKRKPLRFADYIYKRISKFEDLECDGTAVMCTVCKVKLVSTNITHWKEHLRSRKHTRNKSNDFSYATFVCDLIFMFSVCNIPLRVLDKEPFRLFWSKYIPQLELPKRTTARRKLTPIRKAILEKIGHTLEQKKIWIAVDEMTDATGNHVANVVARILDPGGPSPAFLLASKRVEAVNAKTVQNLVVTSLNAMGVTSSQVLMLVTDPAQCMLTAGQLLKAVFPHLIHVTCMVHALHLAAEEIRKNYTWVDVLIATTNQIFVKTTKCIKNFHVACPDIPLPPQPLLTQEAWLEAVLYYHNYFNDVKTFVLQLNPRDSQAISEAQQLFNNQDIEDDIHVIYNNYNVVLDSIHKLKSSSLSLAYSLELLDGVQTVLQSLTDVLGMRVSKRFSDILQKNPGYAKICDVNRCVSEKKFSVDNLHLFFKFANITFVDVERSFLLYTNVFTQRRRRFSEENVETVLLMQMFSRVLSEPLSSIKDS